MLIHTHHGAEFFIWRTLAYHIVALRTRSLAVRLPVLDDTHLRAELLLACLCGQHVL